VTGDPLRRRVRAVEIDGEIFHVRALAGTQVEHMIENEGGESLDGIRALSLVCCFCVCDESGERCYTDDQVDHIRDNAPFFLVKSLGEAALDLSGMGDDSGND